MKKANATELLIFIIGTELAGTLSALLSGSFLPFYLKLNKPALSPPGWVFPVVWTLLYALMGISAYLIKSSDSERTIIKNALSIYIIQLSLNFMWSIIFFRFRSIGAAAAVIVLLLVAAVYMTVRFYRIRPFAAYLNLPYIAWIAFAVYLNFGILFLN